MRRRSKPRSLIHNVLAFALLLRRGDATLWHEWWLLLVIRLPEHMSLFLRLLRNAWAESVERCLHGRCHRRILLRASLRHRAQAAYVQSAVPASTLNGRRVGKFLSIVGRTSSRRRPHEVSELIVNGRVWLMLILLRRRLPLN